MLEKCWSLVFRKLQACNFIEKRLQQGVFLVKFLKTPILKNICERLLVKRDINETEKVVQYY